MMHFLSLFTSFSPLLTPWHLTCTYSNHNKPFRTFHYLAPVYIRLYSTFSSVCPCSDSAIVDLLRFSRPYRSNDLVDRESEQLFVSTKVNTDRKLPKVSSFLPFFWRVSLRFTCTIKLVKKMLWICKRFNVSINTNDDYDSGLPLVFIFVFSIYVLLLNNLIHNEISIK